MEEEQGVVACYLCGSRPWAPRWFSRYSTTGPSSEWGNHFRPSPEVDRDGGRLFWYCACAPSCRANRAIHRYEAARLEIARALEELQAAVLEALAEVADAWAQLDQ